MSQREQAIPQVVEVVVVEPYVVVDEYVVEPEMLCAADMRVDLHLVEECDVDLNEVRDLETLRRHLA